MRYLVTLVEVLSVPPLSEVLKSPFVVTQNIYVDADSVFVMEDKVKTFLSEHPNHPVLSGKKWQILCYYETKTDPLATVLPVDKGHCHWRSNGKDYVTECGKTLLSLYNTSCKVGTFKFCPFCGGKIQAGGTYAKESLP